VRKKKKNIILEKVLVEDYAAEGKSLARVDGKVIFVEQAVPGDLVDIRLTKNKKDWAEGIPVRTHSLSPNRVVPFCAHFGVCGGCQWQMLPYEIQLKYKHRQVEETLRRIGKVKLPEFLAIIGAEDTRYYRNKLEYTFGNKRFILKEELADGSISSAEDVAGFHAKGLFDKVVDIKKCYLQAEPTNEIRIAVKEFAKQRNWPFYDIREHHGFLRTMQVRLCTTGELMVNIVVGENDPEKIEPLMRFVKEKFPSTQSIPRRTIALTISYRLFTTGKDT
jgi:23S rRNA (uracil1939-C5)-methyltransferase